MLLNKRIARHAITGLALVVVVSAIVVWLVGRASEEATAIEAGEAVVVVESEKAYSKANGTVSVGVGVSGTLGLVNGRCVGFVDEPSSTTTEMEQVIVWPPGTTVKGRGEDLQITSEGVSVRLGERIDAGADLRTEFPELAEVLPVECRGMPMIPVGLSS